MKWTCNANVTFIIHSSLPTKAGGSETDSVGGWEGGGGVRDSHTFTE